MIETGARLQTALHLIVDDVRTLVPNAFFPSLPMWTYVLFHSVFWTLSLKSLQYALPLKDGGE